MQTKLIKTFALFLALGFSAACADMAQIEKAQNTANAALEEAKRASAKASKAMNSASEASYAASQAQADASAALKCCNENSLRLDRMFEKAMRK